MKFRSEYMAIVGVLVAGCSTVARTKTVDTIAALTKVAEYAYAQVPNVPADKQAELVTELDRAVTSLRMAMDALERGAGIAPTTALVHTGLCIIASTLAALDLLLPNGVPARIFGLVNQAEAVVGKCK